MENRNALIVETDLTQASGTAEREAALTMIDRHRHVTTKWTKPAATDGPNCRRTEPSKGKSASTEGMKLSSSPVAGVLLQQPASDPGTRCAARDARDRCAAPRTGDSNSSTCRRTP